MDIDTEIKKNFSISEALKFGWKKYKEEFGYILLVVIINLGIALILNAFGNGTDTSKMIANILSLLLGVVIGLGILRSVLKMVSDEQPSLRDFEIEDYKVPVQYIVGTILYLVATLVGLVLLIVPGVIISIRLRFYSYLIIEQDMNAIAALKRSWEMTKGYTWNLFLFTIVTILLNLLAMFALLIPLVITVPVTYIAMGYIYKKLDSVAK